MPGGLIQLAAVGAELETLIGNPQLTHFKMVYKRYANFALEPIEVPLNGSSELHFDEPIRLSCRIDRHADLLSHMYLALDLPDIYSGYTVSQNPEIPNLGSRFQWIRKLGTHMVEFVELTIGGHKIQRLQGEWIQLWHEMYAEDGVDFRTFQHMTGDTPDMHDPAASPSSKGVYPTATLTPTLNTDPELSTTNSSSAISNPYYRTASIRGRTLHIPLHFWFSRNSGAALPLVALQQHEVHVHVQLRPLRELYTIRDTEPSSSTFGLRVAPSLHHSEQHFHNFVAAGATVEAQRQNMAARGDGVDYRRMGSGGSGQNNWYANPRLLCTYVFLDETEQKRFAATSHKYLIEQFVYRFETGVANQYNYNLHLNHPVKSLVWYLQNDDVKIRNDWSNYTNWKTDDPPYSLAAYEPLWGERLAKVSGSSGSDLENIPISAHVRQHQSATPVLTKFDYPSTEQHILKEATLLFNGIELFGTQKADYFRHVQSIQHQLKRSPAGVYSYHFALNPRKWQPSGACDMSRVKQVQLQLTTQDKTSDGSSKYNLHVIAVHYNVVEFMGGMAGLQYAN